MAIHPNLGNLSPVLAAIFVAISSRETKTDGDKIGIAIANGYGYVGFFQLATRPYLESARKDIKNWLKDKEKWCMPYSKDGVLKDVYARSLISTGRLLDSRERGNLDIFEALSKNDRTYRWQTYISDPEIIAKIIRDGSSSALGSRKSALKLLTSNIPVPPINSSSLGERDRINASALIQVEARIPANQIWMWKNYFTIRDVFSSEQPRIEAPFLNQNVWQVYSPRSIKRSRMDYLLRHYDQGDPSVWTFAVHAQVAYDILNVVGYTDTEIKKMFQDFSSYLNSKEKSIYISWLSSLNMGIT